jgi:drug/metabolite transporter (DMT)-like permease
VILKYYGKFKVETLYGIVWNYLVCALIGLLFVENYSIITDFIFWKHAWLSGILGFSFIAFFILIGKSTQFLGVATTTTAFKLSFAIPTIIAVILYNHHLTALQWSGILLAILAVIAISFDSKGLSTGHNAKAIYIMPLLIFIGCGLNDALFNFIQIKLLPDGWQHIITISIFFSAFLFGLLLSIYKKDFYKPRNILGGIVLGIPNYGSLYFLLLALQRTGLESSKLFPINNLGIVVFSAILGRLLFQENFSRQKALGIILAILSIVLIIL